MTDGRWEIPLSDLDLGQAEEEAVLRVIRSGWLTMGAEVSAFEQEFATFCGASDAVSLSSCTAALHLACVALGVGPGAEVIVPTMTFVATANAVVLAGGRPLFADSVGEHDFSMDPADVERRITPKTVGIICVHYGGSPCDIEALQALCQRHGLFLIEDVAHAPGASWNERPLGTIGDIGCFSFFGNKNLTTGEGGMALARDPALLSRMRRLRSHGMTTTSWDRYRGRAFDYEVLEAGLNYRPNELAASVGRVQLGRLPDNNRLRNDLHARYQQRIAPLSGVEMVELRDGGTAHLAVVVMPDRESRDALRVALGQAGIQSSLHYPPVHLFEQFRRDYGYGLGDLPVAESLSDRATTLPLYAHMTPPQVDEVARVLEVSAGALAEPSSPPSAAARLGP